MSKGITRAEKREVQKGGNYFFELIKTARHFFPELIDRIGKVKDPRKQGYITYGPAEVLGVGLIKKLAGIGSMRQMDNAFNTEECIENVYRALNTVPKAELPHHDTVNDYFEALEAAETEKIRDYMAWRLISGRALEKYRLLNTKWMVLIDGTGLFTFHKKHCEHCLKREITNPGTGEKKTIYMHHVLEAKLLAGDMVISLESEFIENENEGVLKQDCELKAFYRLAGKIKKKYPRLPICIVGDSLYACEPVFKLCENNKWNFLIRFKDGSIPTVGEEIEALKEIEGAVKTDKSGTCRYVNAAVTRHREVNWLMQAEETEKVCRRYVFLTDIEITGSNAVKLAGAGRARWKIENKGFNVQKNHRCFIEHAFSENYNAMKNHYLLAQIAEIIIQLYENSSKLVTTVKHGIKEISSLLLESLRTRHLTEEDITNLDIPIQIRFV
jgi:hypothetical protein